MQCVQFVYFYSTIPWSLQQSVKGTTMTEQPTLLWPTLCTAITQAGQQNTVVQKHINIGAPQTSCDMTLLSTSNNFLDKQQLMIMTLTSHALHPLWTIRQQTLLFHQAIKVKNIWAWSNGCFEPCSSDSLHQFENDHDLSKQMRVGERALLGLLCELFVVIVLQSWICLYIN